MTQAIGARPRPTLIENDEMPDSELLERRQHRGRRRLRFELYLQLAAERLVADSLRTRRSGPSPTSAMAVAITAAQ